MSVVSGIGLQPELNTVLASVCKNLKATYISAPTLEECCAALSVYMCDVVFCRLQHQNQQDWSHVLAAGSLAGSPDIIAVIDKGDDEAAEHALQAGVWDVLPMPVDGDLLLASLTRCLHHRASRNILLKDTHTEIRRDGILGNSPILLRCLNQMAVAARSDSSILIMGETGTGKELFAKAVHDNSPRAGKPFVVVDCTNLPPTLAESILFGHVKGSFTGAVEATDGLFKQADGGSIFLDELGELDLNIQKSLLRVIQERRFRPLSAKKEIECDFRIIAATNRDLEKMVHERRFRQDLFHRINTRTFVLPPLRDRKEDIPLLARHYVSVFCKMAHHPLKQLPAETLAALQSYPWPGNIREMVNAMHTAVLNATADQFIFPQHLPEDIRLHIIKARGNGSLSQAVAEETRHLSPAVKDTDQRVSFTYAPEDSSPLKASSVLAARSTGGGSVMAGNQISEIMTGWDLSTKNNSELSAVSQHGIDSIRSFLENYEAQEKQNPADMKQARHAPKDNEAEHGSALSQTIRAADENGSRGAIDTHGGVSVNGSNIRLTTSTSYWRSPGNGGAKALQHSRESSDIVPFKEAREKAVSSFEAKYLQDIAGVCRGDFAKAMHLSGLSRARLYELLKKHDISI